MAEQEKPLPCPFCGCPPTVERASNDKKWWIVGCLSAACDPSPEVQKEGRDAAVAAWNQRFVLPPAPDAAPERQRRIDETARALLAAMVADHGAYTETPEGWRSVEDDVRRAYDAAELLDAKRERRLRAEVKP